MTKHSKLSNEACLFSQSFGKWWFLLVLTTFLEKKKTPRVPKNQTKTNLSLVTPVFLHLLIVIDISVNQSQPRTFSSLCLDIVDGAGV